MIYYVDNFLPQDQFDALAKRVQSGFRGDTSSLVENSDEPLRVTHHDHSGDWEEGCNFLGQECRPAIRKNDCNYGRLRHKRIKELVYMVSIYY